jgi:hypothetical protein
MGLIWCLLLPVEESQTDGGGTSNGQAHAWFSGNFGCKRFIFGKPETNGGCSSNWSDILSSL